MFLEFFLALLTLSLSEQWDAKLLLRIILQCRLDAVLWRIPDRPPLRIVTERLFGLDSMAVKNDKKKLSNQEAQYLFHFPSSHLNSLAQDVSIVLEETQNSLSLSRVPTIFFSGSAGTLLQP